MNDIEILKEVLKESNKRGWGLLEYTAKRDKMIYLAIQLTAQKIFAELEKIDKGQRGMKLRHLTDGIAYKELKQKFAGQEHHELGIDESKDFKGEK